MNDSDIQILKILQGNARTSNAEIARRIGLAPSAVLERIRKLESRGLIAGYTARLNARALGRGLCAFVFVRLDGKAGEVEAAQRIARVPETLEVHHVAGEDCFLVKVRISDTEALGKLLSHTFGAIPHVRSTRTTIVLETAKETTAISLDGAGEATEGGGDSARRGKAARPGERAAKAAPRGAATVARRAARPGARGARRGGGRPHRRGA
jgi:Lrp/AsnC family leucine-responsive transcriptional regulator